MPNSTTAKMLDPAADASRFLAQASFGADLDTINALAGQDYSAWIDEQRTKPMSLTEPYMIQIMNEANNHWSNDQQYFSFRYYDNGFTQAKPDNFSTAWMRNIVFGDDPLRQRVTWSLNQIFVVSYNSSLRGAGNSLAHFYDTLAQHAFGNFRDLLLDVSLHSAMCFYLSSLGNQKADPSINRYPDENYAREIMQLFTIGLWELNPDGTRQTDASGNPIPTYDNEDIAELARVFTGLWFPNRDFGRNGVTSNKINTMLEEPVLTVFANQHDQDAKTVFHDKAWETAFPAGQGGTADIEQAVDMLFNHPNCAPFICKQLIQFLVKSHPSPAYIERIANVFADNGSGVRGDLFAVVKALLLDTEARTYDPTDLTSGKLIEPMVRVARLVKAFKAGQNNPDLVWWWYPSRGIALGQWPMYSPSVFNFFEPEYVHLQTPLGDADINSPEFMIITPITVPELANFFRKAIFVRIHELYGYAYADPPDFVCDFTEAIALDTAQQNTDALIDHVAMLLCYGELSEQTRNVVRAAVDFFPETNDNQRLKRVQAAIYMLTIAPEGAILR